MISVIIPVYRNAEAAVTLVERLAEQVLPKRAGMEVVLVDDGSGGDCARRLQAFAGPDVRLVKLAENAGRAVARNQGARLARGDVLVFVDSDCRPSENSFLDAHVRMLDHGCVASCGPIMGPDQGFWARYQHDASRRRRRQHARNEGWAGSAANLAVHRDTFESVGGFDSRYLAYGFEDRDLLVRLAKQGKIGWCDDAGVEHGDPLTLPGVLTKMRRAAGPSAVLFSHDHPEAYRRLGYARIDSRLHPWLRPLGMLAGPVLGNAGRLEPLLQRKALPYAPARGVVKILCALAFCVGSTGRHEQQEPAHEP